MDPFAWAFSCSKNRSECNDEAVSSFWDPNAIRRFHPEDTSQDHGMAGLPLNSNVPNPETGSSDPSKGLDGDSSEGNIFSDAILAYINQVVMQDDLDDKAYSIQDSTLDATEQSLYEILHEKHPSSPNQLLSHEETSSSSEDSTTNCYGNCSCSCISAYNSHKSGIISDLQNYQSSTVCNPYMDHLFLDNSQAYCYSSCSCHTVVGFVDSATNQSSRSFNMTDDSKVILPSESKGIFDFENRASPVTAERAMEGKAMAEKDGGNLSGNLMRGRKNLLREENGLDDGRSNKQLALYAEDSVIHEMFDKVLSLYGENDDSVSKTGSATLLNEKRDDLQQNEPAIGATSKISLTKKGVKKRQAVDMRTLLMQYMQSVSDNDHRNANKLLKQIRTRASPLGDGSQRLAHYFANGLEARLLGKVSPEHKALADKSMSGSDGMKAYKMYISTFPFMGTSYYFTARMTMELAENANTLHIIHFGILCGLQCCTLIQQLSTRPGGPPKLRITGIDLPQPGFRPNARVEETGHRLAKYCAMFNVPFEYNGIAQEWETVSVGDLRIEKGEVLVVNCLYQFMYLLDDTIMEHSPRDAVLNLIRRINPDIFIHGIVNGSYNSPFFISRFRQALFYFSALFDMFDANVPRENPERIVFERDIWGKEILNILACEGVERVERPETYKQWQIRTLRAGFRQLPLNQQIIKEIRDKVKSCYHKDFSVDESSQWMLQGWKGRVIFALSCWKPE